MDNLSVAKQKWNLAHIFLITTLVLTNIHCLCHTGIHCKTIVAQSRAINLRTWFTWLNFCASTFFSSPFFVELFSPLSKVSCQSNFIVQQCSVISNSFQSYLHAHYWSCAQLFIQEAHEDLRSTMLGYRTLLLVITIASQLQSAIRDN